MPRMMQKLTLHTVLLALVIGVLNACGGGGDNKTGNDTNPITSKASFSISSRSPSPGISTETDSSRASVNSVSEIVTLSGKITYDFVPHNENHVGLNYSAIEQRPVRGIVVELVNDFSQTIASTTTADDGRYVFNVPQNTVVKVRAKAQMLKSNAPSWNFKVTDNTSGNALYVLDGALASVGTEDSKRDLNAISGWDGTAYSSARAAAPFAILDSIYTAANRLMLVGNTKNLKPLELRWSTKNSTADGDVVRGEIGTSYYDGSAIYVLGNADHDTDEYDPHVLLHEWGHYLEAQLYRSDSLGGAHADGDVLDLRVAMSEGFANAFSGMMINDGNYADASGTSQASGFNFSIGRKKRTNRGFFNEGSIGSVLFNYYASGDEKAVADYFPIHSILSSASYLGSEALTSIYLFNQQLKNMFPNHAPLFSDLLQEQHIFGTDEYAANESNSAASINALPIYKTLAPNDVALNVCSSPDFGKQNKLGNSQLIKLNINQAGIYNLRVNRSGGANAPAKPEFVLYSKGTTRFYGSNSQPDMVSTDLSLLPGNYILEVYDFNNRDNKNTDANTTCFDVRVRFTQ